MTWPVLFHDEFAEEFGAFPEAVQDELLAHAKLLEAFGPSVGQPRVRFTQYLANLKDRT